MKSNVRRFLYIILTVALILFAQSLNNYIGQFWSDTVTCFILIISVMLFETIQCTAIALISPFVAKILGITDFPIAILSVIALSNILYITIYTIAFQVFASNSIYQKVFTWGTSVIISALLKFGLLYLFVDKILLNIMEINTTITYQFGSIQFYTSLLAGVFAFFVIKPIKKATKI